MKQKGKHCNNIRSVVKLLARIVQRLEDYGVYYRNLDRTQQPGPAITCVDPDFVDRIALGRRATRLYDLCLSASPRFCANPGLRLNTVKG
jgi:hypothetical protein